MGVSMSHNSLVQGSKLLLAASEFFDVAQALELLEDARDKNELLGPGVATVLNEKGADGKTALNRALHLYQRQRSTQHGFRQVDEADLNELLSALQHLGATLDQPDGPCGRTPLLCAVNNGQLGPLRALIRQGCDIEASDNAGETALFAAARLGYSAMLRELVEAGADLTRLNPQGLTLLEYLPLQSRLIVDVVRLLLRKGPAEWRDTWEQARRLVPTNYTHSGNFICSAHSLNGRVAPFHLGPKEEVPRARCKVGVLLIKISVFCDSVLPLSTVEI